MKKKKKSTEAGWNYRIVRRKYAQKGGPPAILYEIYEVYYGIAFGLSRTVEPARIQSDDIKGIAWTLKVMRQALKRPVLDYEKDFKRKLK